MNSQFQACAHQRERNAHRWLRWLVIFMVVLALGGGRAARAHTEQKAPTRVEIWPQRSFLMARIAGEGSDLNDIIHATFSPGDHEEGAAPQGTPESATFTPEIAINVVARERAERYLGAHLTLKQNGVRLRGALRDLRMWRPASEHPSETRFEALYRFERAPQLAGSPLQVSSKLFDSLAGVRTVVDLGGDVQELNVGQTASFAPALTVATTSKNARDWAASGFMHIFSAWEYALFLLALTLSAAQRRLRVTLFALGAFTLAHAATFALAILGAFTLAPQIVGVGVAASVAALGIFDWWQARACASSAARVNRVFVALCALCGLVHGFAPAPALRLLGLPESGLGASLAAFVVGMLVAQLGLGALFVAGWKKLRARFEDSAQYGGMGWPRATQWAASLIVVVAAFWTLERWSA